MQEEQETMKKKKLQKTTTSSLGAAVQGRDHCARWTLAQQSLHAFVLGSENHYGASASSLRTMGRVWKESKTRVKRSIHPCALRLTCVCVAKLSSSRPYPYLLLQHWPKHIRNGDELTNKSGSDHYYMWTISTRIQSFQWNYEIEVLSRNRWGWDIRLSIGWI